MMSDVNTPDHIFCCDPAPTASGFAILDSHTMLPIEFGKIPNAEIRDKLLHYAAIMRNPVVVIESMMNMGGHVGKSVFDTCYFIGRLTELAESNWAKVEYVTRRDEKMTLVGAMSAKDKDLRRALINHMAVFDKVNGKGSKDKPDTFYKCSADAWSAIGIGVTWLLMQKGESWVPPKDNKKAVTK